MLSVISMFYVYTIIYVIINIITIRYVSLGPHHVWHIDTYHSKIELQEIC